MYYVLALEGFWVRAEFLFQVKCKDIFLNRIEHEYMCYCSNLLLVIAFRPGTVLSVMYDLKEIVQLEYQSYLTFLWHGENLPRADIQCEYFYHIWFFTAKRHENFTDSLPK